MSKSDNSGAAPLHDLTAFQRDLLVAMASIGPAHGLGLKEHLEQEYGEQQINHGRLYPNLDELVETGLASKESRDRRTNEYDLTPRGRRELAAHRSWVGGGDA